jgi:hypothetical protein
MVSSRWHTKWPSRGCVGQFGSEGRQWKNGSNLGMFGGMIDCVAKPCVHII